MPCIVIEADDALRRFRVNSKMIYIDSAKTTNYTGKHPRFSIQCENRPPKAVLPPATQGRNSFRMMAVYMHHLRQSILLLTLLLSAFVMIEHLPFEMAGALQLQSFVYLLVPIILLVTVGVPPVRRAPASIYLLAWMAIYFLSKLVIFYEGNPQGWSATGTVMFAELAVVIAAVGLARDLAGQLHTSEELSAKIILAGAGPSFPSFDQAIDDVKTELSRSRRYRHTLSVVVLDLDTTHNPVDTRAILQQIQEGVVRQYVAAKAGAVLTGILRCTDLVLEQSDQGRFIVLCPEVDATAAQEFLTRIRAAMGKAGLKGLCAARAFPQGAITLDEVIEYVHAPLPITSERESTSSWYSEDGQKASRVPVSRESP